MMHYFTDSSGGLYAVESLDIPVPHGAQKMLESEAVALLEARREADRQQPIKKVTMRQARLALLNAGLLDSVNNAIASMAGQSGDMARIEWEFSSEVWRDRPLVLSLAPALNMSDTQLDHLFLEASKL